MFIEGATNGHSDPGRKQTGKGWERASKDVKSMNKTINAVKILHTEVESKGPDDKKGSDSVLVENLDDANSLQQVILQICTRLIR